MVIDCSNYTDDNLSDYNQTNCTNSTHFNGTAEVPLYFYIIAPVATFLLASIFVIGVIGNFLVCYTVITYKDMRDNIFHIFLANLSIADLLVVAVCVPTAMVDVFSQEKWYFGEHMCKAVPLLEYSVSHLSVLTILAISFERFLAIIFPLKAQYISTRNRSLIIIVIIWLVAFITSIPFALIATYIEEKHSGENKLVSICYNPMDAEWKTAYQFATVIVFFIAPFFILCVVYAFISHHLIRDSYKSLGVATDISSANMRARKQVVIMLATVVATFFIFLLPFRVLSLWTIYAPRSAYVAMGEAGWMALLNFARIMFYLNSASNPIVLYAMSSKFRAKFQHILCRRPLPPGTNSVSRSGTLRYSVRTEYNSSFRHSEPRPMNYSFTSNRAVFSNGNGKHTSIPAEEYPML